MIIATKLTDLPILIERNVQLKEDYSFAVKQIEAMNAKNIRLSEKIKQSCVSRRKWRKARIEIALMIEG